MLGRLQTLNPTPYTLILQKIKAQLDAGDNVVFCSNHQSESDTHCYFTLMEDQMGPEFGEIARNTVLKP
jgi:hypothetical protein